ncbi:MAG TPA: fibronectin type III domain-containing protein [Thermoanaerobaculaceae bacterium]|nr:fibronectin type III domain-containing protein [Thermoanaerobaculaceae bacterium]
MKTVRFLVLATAVLALGSCGRKSLPLPPIIEVPETTTDLWGYQDGTDIVLNWSYPTLTRGGRSLNDLARVEVWRLQVAPGQEQVGSGPAGEDLRRQLMLGRGKLVARLEGESLQAATRGKSLTYRERLPEVAAGTSPPTLWYAVRSRRQDGTSSALSNFLSWQPQPVPPTPTSLVADPHADGISLSWDSVPGVTYIVERRASKAAGWEFLQPLGIEKPTYLDTKAEQGQTWWYRVRSYVKTAVSTVSPPTPEVEVPYPDIYPPPPVASLLCLPEPSLVRLRWDPSPEAGARYKIFRRVTGGAWQHLEEAFAGTEYTDSSPPGAEVEYAVKAIDKVGNQSDAVYCKVRAGT